MRNPLTLPLIALTAALAGCTVGPDYAPPKTSAAPEWVEQASLAPVDLEWWDQFHDPMLSSLVERAIASAPDARVAEARLAEARANRDATYGGRAPQGAVTGSATENVLSKNGQLPIASIPGFSRDFSLFDIGFDASWEIDLWGRQRRAEQAADARAGAALEAKRDVQLRLAAEVARSYTDLRSAQRQVALRQALAEDAQGRAQLAQQLYKAGDASRIDAEQAQAAASAAAAQVPQAQAQAAAAAYRIAALLGVPPEQVVPELEKPAPLPEAPRVINAGLRSGLLQRRPDVRRAERELAAATAGIGIAKADLFPRLTLMGSAGSQARSLGDIASGDSLRLGIGPSFSWPIFSFGRIRAQIRAADARADGAAAAWQGAVAGALADSEASINRHARAQEALDKARSALASQQEAARLARQRYEAGEDSRIQWLTAKSRLGEAELAATQAQSAALDASIALFKALGGGWDQSEN